MTEVAPVLPVRNLDMARTHYSALGFEVEVYGLREGAHVDPDGNLLRFGSPLPPPG